MTTTIRDGLQLLAGHGGVVEARLLDTPQRTMSGYFDDLAKLEAALRKWDGRVNLYISANPVLPDLLARAHNRLKGWVKEATRDEEIRRRVWFLIDTDAVRSRGISSTADELAAALTRRNDVLSFCQALGFPAPFLGMSGNGGHAGWAVDLPNDVATRTLFEHALNVLHAYFSDNLVNLDDSIFNAARIWKVYGSLVVKGDALPERPHRRAVLEAVPTPLACLPRERLEALAALTPPVARTISAPSRGPGHVGPRYNLIEAFQAKGWYKRPLDGGKHAVVCPWASEHSGDSGLTESVLFEPQGPGESWGFDCKHAHCSQRTIRDVLTIVQVTPDAEPAVPDPHPGATPGGTVASRPTTLEDVHALFRQHYGEHYDTGALDAVIAAAATTFLTGDPVWLLVIGGSGGLKTETVTAARLMPGATATGTITSVGALLSGTAQPQRARDATGGLLKRIGNPGLLLIKDVSSILSMNRDARALVLAALREIYDGSWIREVGTDGGRTLRWQGRLVIIGAVTTAWDHAHAVIAAMGDRFVLVRLDTNDPDVRQEAGDQSISNVGHEGEIRQDVAEAVLALLRTAGATGPPLPWPARTRCGSGPWRTSSPAPGPPWRSTIAGTSSRPTPWRCPPGS
jgi:hypothetical protein